MLTITIILKPLFNYLEKTSFVILRYWDKQNKSLFPPAIYHIYYLVFCQGSGKSCQHASTASWQPIWGDKVRSSSTHYWSTHQKWTFWNILLSSLIFSCLEINLSSPQGVGVRCLFIWVHDTPLNQLCHKFVCKSPGSQSTGVCGLCVGAVGVTVCGGVGSQVSQQTRWP